MSLKILLVIRSKNDTLENNIYRTFIGLNEWSRIYFRIYFRKEKTSRFDILEPVCQQLRLLKTLHNLTKVYIQYMSYTLCNMQHIWVEIHLIFYKAIHLLALIRQLASISSDRLFSVKTVVLDVLQKVRNFVYAFIDLIASCKGCNFTSWSPGRRPYRQEREYICMKIICSWSLTLSSLICSQ